MDFKIITKKWLPLLSIGIRGFLLYATLFFMAPLPILYSTYVNIDTVLNMRALSHRHAQAPVVKVNESFIETTSFARFGRMSGFIQKEHVCKIEYVYRLAGEEKIGNVVALDGAIFGDEQKAKDFCGNALDHAQQVYYLPEKPGLITLTLPEEWSYGESIEWIVISIFALTLWWFFSGWAVRYFVLNDDGDNIYLRDKN